METRLSKKLEPIPKEISNGCPDFCPVCFKPVVMVWRSWGKFVEVCFVHSELTLNDCYKIYSYGKEVNAG